MTLVRRLGRGIALLAVATGSVAGCANEDSSGARDTSSPETPPTVEAFKINDSNGTLLIGDPQEAAVAYVRNFGSELGLTAQDDFKVRQVHQGRGQQLHVRLTQLHD